ncbi:MAG TPA: hypothetical protein VFS21_21375 [Roseiflexaceae bacterium]|nr:hypothetical protein [Roseiflexaceae bacterium]
MIQKRPRWGTLIVVSAISLVVLWRVPFPQEGTALGRAAWALVSGR